MPCKWPVLRARLNELIKPCAQHAALCLVNCAAAQLRDNAPTLDLFSIDDFYLIHHDANAFWF